MSKGVILGLAVLGGLGAVVASQQPEIRRYLRIRSM
jgi:uncharacterized protein DUF6893